MIEKAEAAVEKAEQAVEKPIHKLAEEDGTQLALGSLSRADCV